MKTKILLLIVGGLMLTSAIPALATHQAGHGNPGDDQRTNRIQFTFPNPFRFQGGLYEFVQAIVNNIVLPIGGVLCVLAFIYAGFMYVISRGDKAKIETAHRALLYAAIGTAVLLGAWVIANVIRNTVNQLIV